jgi:hypothetical protein
VRYYLLLATDLSYAVHADDHTGLVEEIARMLQGLINSIEQRTDK